MTRLLLLLSLAVGLALAGAGQARAAIEVSITSPADRAHSLAGGVPVHVNAQASGTVGSLTGFNRRYRFEVHTDTTIAQFAAALGDPAFAR